MIDSIFMILESVSNSYVMDDTLVDYVHNPLGQRYISNIQDEYTSRLHLQPFIINSSNFIRNMIKIIEEKLIYYYQTLYDISMEILNLTQLSDNNLKKKKIYY